MKRGPKDAASDILQVIGNPNIAPTRLMARTGVGYKFLDALLTHELLKLEPISERRRRRLRITEKRRTFLQHYCICNELLPSQCF